jgi:hypothetical protein
LHPHETLNAHHFGIVEATVLKYMASRFPPIIRGFPCTHRRSLNVLHFGMVEGMGLKTVISRSPSMASTP